MRIFFLLSGNYLPPGSGSVQRSTQIQHPDPHYNQCGSTSLICFDMVKLQRYGTSDSVMESDCFSGRPPAFQDRAGWFCQRLAYHQFYIIQFYYTPSCSLSTFPPGLLIPTHYPYCLFVLLFHTSTQCCRSGTGSELDPYQIRIQELCGSGAVFRIRIRIHTCKNRIKYRDKRFKV